MGDVIFSFFFFGTPCISRRTQQISFADLRPFALRQAPVLYLGTLPFKVDWESLFAKFFFGKTYPHSSSFSRMVNKIYAVFIFFTSSFFHISS